MSAGRWIAVRMPNWLGDGALAAPALRALSAANPEARVLLIAPAANAALYGRWPAAGLVEIERRGVVDLFRAARLLRSLEPEAAVHLAPSFRAALPAYAAGVGRRIGFPSDHRSALLTHVIAEPPRSVHLARQFLRLVEPLGANPDAPLDPRLPVGEDEADAARERLGGWGLSGEETIALCPGATYGPTKRWPPEHWIELARSLARRGFRLLILGGEGESEIARRIEAEVGSPARAVAGALGLRGSLAVLAQIAAAVSNDSGAMHLAAAAGCPTLGLFGSTNPQWTGPLGRASGTVTLSLPCAPCYGARCPTSIECLRDLAPRRVETELLALLESGREIHA
jgi:heptosyltransferase-2